MRRCVLVLALTTFALAACGRAAKGPTNGTASTDAVPESSLSNGSPHGIMLQPGMGTLALAPMGGAGSLSGGPPPGMMAPMPQTLFGNLSEVEKKEGFDAAVAEGLRRMANRKWNDALTAFIVAQNYKIDEGVGAIIIKLDLRLLQEERAKQTAFDIQAILNVGKPAEAAQFAAEAFLQFSHTGAASAIEKLARQANAIVAADNGNKAEQFARLTSNFRIAASEKNLRAEAFALEQALLFGDDDGLRKELERIHNMWTKFDALRTRASELRRDPAQLEGAIATWEEAAKIPDAPSVQADLDDCRFALHYRRDRLAVVEFAVRGEIGVPEAGAFVAGELAASFKGKFDIVERGEIDKIVADLKLEKGLIDDDLAQQILGEIAKSRYLIVGTVSPIAGITVQARLVDVKTGLISQTARISAANADDLAKRIPHLGRILAMTDLAMIDIEKRNFEEKQAAPPVAVPALKLDPNMDLPPPPELPTELPPPPVIPNCPKPPVEPANLQPDQFANLPPPPGVGQRLPAVVLPPDRELDFRRRAAFASLELGDNFFRRGRFREAFVQFEFCLNLFPENRRVRARIELCRPLLPPLPSSNAAPVYKPRVAALDFLTFGNPTAVPPYLGPWTAEALAPYFCPQFELVDRSILHWWMGRLGITQADLLNDPVARQYLGRALGTRYFLFGNLIESTGFDVLTYFVDAEYGFLAAGVGIHVRNFIELKMRLSEIALLVQLTPDERMRFERDAALWELRTVDIRRLRQNSPDAEHLGQCAAVCRRALEMRPNNVEMQCILDGVERQLRQMQWEATNNKYTSDQFRFSQNQGQRQASLEDAIDLARRRADRVAPTERRSLQQQREAAARALVVQARAALEGRYFSIAISCYESAAALAPSDALFRELSAVWIKAENTARADAASAATAREAALRAKWETKLAQARAGLDRELPARAALDSTRSKIAEERERTEAARLIDEAEKLSQAGKWPEAVSVAQTAQRLRWTAEGERLVNQWLIQLAKANVERQGAAALADFERGLEAEREARGKAELEANINRQKFSKLSMQANRAMQSQQFDAAVELYQTAKAIHATDAVLTGLNRANEAKAQALTKAEADRRAAQDEPEKTATQKQRLADAETALAAQQFDKGADLFREAKTLAPNDIAVLAGLLKVEYLQEREYFAARQIQEEASKKAAFEKFVDSGKANLAANKFTAAAVVLGEAMKLYPNDAKAMLLLAEAAARADADDVQKKTESYQALIRRGRRLQATKQYNEAQQKYGEAGDAISGDKAATEFRIEAGRAKVADELKLVLKIGYDRMAAGKWSEARSAFDRAPNLDKDNPELVKARKDLRQAAIHTARNAMTAKKYDEAIKAYTSVLSLDPKDAEATKGMAEAKQSRQNAKTAK